MNSNDMPGAPQADPFVDNLHVVSSPDTLWSRVNSAEAMPGVHTPLSWDFWDRASERAMRGSYHDLGVLTAAEVEQPARIDERCWAVFHGRTALNVEFYRGVGDRTPNTSGDEFERAILGSVRPGVTSRRSRRRYPFIFVRAPLLARRTPGMVERNYHQTDAWWRQCVSPAVTADAAGACRRLAEAVERFEYVMRVHCCGTSMAQRGYGQLARLARESGKPGLETRLSGGYVDTEDVIVMSALWEVSRGRSTLDDFVRAHGYHGPAEGQLASRVWREDRSPLEKLVETYRGMREEQAPLAVAKARAVEREEAERELLAAVPSRTRNRVARMLADLGRNIALRERGKVTFLRAIDAGRAAARTIGTDFARRGLLEDPEDVFFLLRSEFMSGLHPQAREIVAFRRRRWCEHAAVELPDTWVGNPQARPAAPEEAGDGDLTGMPASSGRVEGIARVLTDPSNPDALEPGDILVCHTTDPSWSALMLVSGGLVIDIGGPMSHGAIIARELGVPCVINTRSGTRRLRSGDRIAVDGDAGVVRILARA
ncbi:MAG: PEP-utilizing enzyme [Gammaproteobacteria bacterium]